MKFLVKSLIGLGLLSACASPSMPPMMMGVRGPVGQFNQFSNPSMNRFNAATPQGNFPFGLGMQTQGAQPMDGMSTQLFEQPEGLRSLARRPEQVDLRPGFPPVYNQGATNACVGFSTIGGLGEFYARKRGWNMRFSPRYLWTLGRKFDGNLNQNVGMMIDDAQKILDNYGMLPEQSYPFPVLDPRQNPALFEQMLSERPSNQQIDEAKKFRISQGWKRVPSVSAMRTALADGKPVVFGIAVFSNIAQTGPDGLIPMPGPNDTFEGGHAVVAVGYDNTRKVFIIRNSWGENWGDHGYGYLPYEFFRGVVNQVPAYAGFTVK